MEIIDNLISEVNKPISLKTSQSMAISDAKGVSGIICFFLLLWFVPIIIGLAAGIRGDESTSFLMFLFSCALGLLSVAIGIWAVFKEDVYRKRIGSPHISVKRLKTLSIILILSPIIYVIVVVITDSLVKTFPFAGG